MGTNDPRLNSFGKIDLRIRSQLRGYAKADPPPTRTKPVPVQVCINAIKQAIQHGHIKSLAISDMMTLGYYFLLHPGEHTAPTNEESTPFRLCDVELKVGVARYNATTIPLDLLPNVSFVLYTFTTQKNSVRGEVIGLGRSGHPHFCPVAATCSRVLHLQQNNAPPDTPVCLFYANQQAHYVTSDDITMMLQLAVRSIGPENLGFLPEDISARSLHAAGAIALLCTYIDSVTIRLIGRWHSDEML